jgi:hypothetical protein
MKGSKSKFRHEKIAPVLNEALADFASRGGNLPKTVKGTKEEKFRHISDICCVQNSSDLPPVYLLCWHLAYLLRVHAKLLTVEDLLTGSQIEQDTSFNSKKEFAQIQNNFAKIINQEVVAEIGLFYSPENDHSRRTAGLCLLSQSQVCFFDCTVHVPF